MANVKPMSAGDYRKVVMYFKKNPNNSLKSIADHYDMRFYAVKKIIEAYLQKKKPKRNYDSRIRKAK